MILMVGRVEKYLLDRIKTEGAIHMTLIDPEKVTAAQASRIADKAKLSGTSAVMVGGSTFVSTTHLDSVVKAIKRSTKTPVILFPNNVTGISRFADAIWFMSLLNSVDPYFLIGAQVLGATLVRKYRIEPMPMGYIIVGEGGTASVVGKAVPIPYSKPEVAVAHALAGQYLGMRFVYLEGGSGAKKPVPPEMIRAVKSCIAASAGADMIVTGNVVENTAVKQKVSEIVEGLKGYKS